MRSLILRMRTIGHRMDLQLDEFKQEPMGLKRIGLGLMITKHPMDLIGDQIKAENTLERF